MKRCADCSYFRGAFKVRSVTFIVCEGVNTQKVFKHTADDCLGYKRKWWKFWRPQ